MPELCRFGGICYASEEVDSIKVQQVKPLQGRILLVSFNNGERRLFDTTQLAGSAFKCLEQDEIFMHPSVLHGFVSWNDGSVDIAPETLYDGSIVYNEDSDLETA